MATSLDDLTRDLEAQGVETFEKSYESLLRVLEDAAGSVETGTRSS